MSRKTLMCLDDSREPGDGRSHRNKFPGAALVVTSVLALTSPAWAGGVQINELQPANDRTLPDEDGDYSDWIELWNPSRTALDLGGCGLSDRVNSPFKWRFAPGTTLPANGFLVVFASGKDRQPELAPPVDPATVTGLQVWLRADAVEPSDPAQVRIAGGDFFLRHWSHAGGEDFHAVQTQDALQPRWIPGTAESVACLRFDGIDDGLRLSRPAGTNDFCVFAVCRTSQAHESDPENASGVGGVNGQRWLFGASHGGDLDAGAGVSVGTNGVAVYEHGSGYMPALAAYPRPIGDGLQIIAVNYTDRRPVLDHQGLAVRNGLTSTRREVWAPVEIGFGAYGAFGGDLLEVLIYDRALTPDERRGIARHLAGRYAVDLPLPKHTNFQLSAQGEEIVLTGSDGTTLDRVTFGEVPRDLSYGRPADTLSEWRFFATPTPGAPNTTPGSTAWLLPPGLSHESGFYSEAFELSLTSATADAEIRYTLNGSEPTIGSPLFINPISIRSRLGTPNFLSLIPTVPGGQPPAGEVFKGWTVRARAFKADALPSAIATRTYWIHSRGRERYSLPVVALTTERKHFFDPDIGIYVPGNAPGGNYSQRGPEWERPVHVEFIETNGLTAFAQDGDIKIHGNTSQGFPIKGLDLDATGGAGREPFRHRIFLDRNRTEFEHLMLRPSGHDHGMAFMRDELMQSLGAETGAESQAARPCLVFLNGEYWGLHYLKEKQDDDFVSFYGGVPDDGFDYLEGYASAKAGDTRHYDALVQFLATNDPAQASSFDKIQAWMEVPNYIDYKVTEIFNYRWDIGNHRLWRPRTPEGRWRWLQFDNDVGWGGFWAEQPGWSYDMLAADLSVDGRLHGHNNETTTFLLRRLMLNPDFRRDFVNRFADLLNTLLLPEVTLERVEQFAAPLAPEMAEHCQRWRAPASFADWQTAVEYLREFARRRPDFCREHLRRNLNLAGTVRLQFGVSPEEGGTLQVNTLVLPEAGALPWTGTYFKGNPIRLIARPLSGFEFAGWTGLPGVVTNDIRLMPAGDWAITARFIPATPARLQASWTPSASLHVSIVAAPGTSWNLESSPDLSSWSKVSVLVADASGKAGVVLPAEAGLRSFFRARRVQP
ncbi:MAG: CotH kinase family protein [Limisphaerales bacterium]